MPDLVSLSYENLLKDSQDLSDAIESAFGPLGLGILLISDVPGLILKRKRLLYLACELAGLADKSDIEDEASSYSFGWSHGKEKLSDGRPDVYKGSFYANPIHDDPCGDLELAREHPEYLRQNIWPSRQLPDLEPAFKDLGRLIVDVGEALVSRCDLLASRKGIPPGTLVNSIARSRNHKARLLYYFPPSPAPMAPFQGAHQGADNWCGWHLDHGSITGLTSGMFFDPDGAEVSETHPDAGLFVKDRNGLVIKASIPSNCLAFQMGEALQISSGDLLRATPHCVRSSSAASISRSTFAVFIQPAYDETLVVPNGFTSSVSGWLDGMTFSEFSKARFKQYYEKKL